MSAQKKPFAKTHIVCGVLIRRDDKYLLVQEKQAKVHGTWNLPAGHVDEGETLEQAAIREAKEECGLDVTLKAHLLTLHQAVERPVLHAFLAEVTGGTLSFPRDEILDAKWFSYEDIVRMKDALRNEVYVIGAIEKADLT